MCRPLNAMVPLCSPLILQTVVAVKCAVSRTQTHMVVAHHLHGSVVSIQMTRVKDSLAQHLSQSVRCSDQLESLSVSQSATLSLAHLTSTALSSLPPPAPASPALECSRAPQVVLMITDIHLIV